MHTLHPDDDTRYVELDNGEADQRASIAHLFYADHGDGNGYPFNVIHGPL